MRIKPSAEFPPAERPLLIGWLEGQGSGRGQGSRFGDEKNLQLISASFREGRSSNREEGEGEKRGVVRHLHLRQPVFHFGGEKKEKKKRKKREAFIGRGRSISIFSVLKLTWMKS